MDAILVYLLGAATFVPHGYCLLWRPDLVAMHALSDLAIALAYLTIPAAIFTFRRKRPDLGHPWVATLFILFILLCGLTHAVGVWSLWQPIYGLQGLVKMTTAAVSVATAISLWPLMPRLVALPSPTLLAEKAVRLEAEIARREVVETALRKAHDELERRVAERTRELADAKAEAEHLALHDSLTGVANRRLLERHLDQALQDAQPQRGGFALAVVDLDDFKSVNDRYGHLAGDALLIEVARRLQASLRPHDLVARLGGDEFAVVATGHTSRAEAQKLASRLMAAIAQPCRLGPTRLRPRASLGLAIALPGRDDADRLFARADRAVYAAKRVGGDRWCLCMASTDRGTTPARAHRTATG